MKNTLKLILSVFGISLFLAACDRNSCEDVICPAMNSTCVNGQCVCQAGFEGEFCDIFSYQKYLGTYQVSESCTTTFTGFVNTPTYQASIGQGFRVDLLTISNFANRGLPVDATIVSANFLSITSQNSGAVQVSGGQGEFQQFANRIRFEYNYTVGNNFHSCTAIFIRF